ncbi:hypothetical protein tpqmel_0841 [Candidatus Gastranaerophilus sp. (ex Termes propinquus)]|nr:hypothetical protein tpqmel_0841 [Candidatus Gastranaerophilus sp. (ex Termes propinquus)]
MSGYLNKEEIRQWRSSLEKITLEEFAQRLGKTLKEEKQTNDIVDLVLKNESSSARTTTSDSASKKENVLKLAQKSIDMQNTMPKTAAKDSAQAPVDAPKQESKVKLEDLNITPKKPLTEREATVLSVFLDNKDKIVYAKDLGDTLDLPTDYVYKYIKNLRAKIGQDILENAAKGGYRISEKIIIK